MKTKVKKGQNWTPPRPSKKYTPAPSHPTPYFYVRGKRFVKCVMCGRPYRRSRTLPVGERVKRHTILPRACVWCISSTHKSGKAASQLDIIKRNRGIK